MEPMNSDDAAIEEFHAAARRRRRLIMTVTALACLAIGAVILIVAFTAAGETDGDGSLSGHRYEVRTIAFGIGFIIAGLGAGVMAVKGE